jgi:hypothetical protein
MADLITAPMSAVVLAFLLAPGCHHGANVMNPNNPEGPQQAILQLEGGQRKITIEEATRIRQAVLSFLADRRSEVTAAIPSNLLEYFPKSAGEPLIDGSFNLRLPPWLAEARGKTIVLTHRPLPPGNFQFILSLAEEQGEWKVASVSWEKLMPRR